MLTLGKKGLVSLMALKDHDLLSKLNFVVVGRDTSIQNDYSNEIKEFCNFNEIKWYTRQSFEQEKLSCDFLVAIGWRWLVNTDHYKLITIHDSLLPKYRGFNPLVTALVEGDKMIGATALFANEEIDSGNIVSQESIEIDYPIKIQVAIDKIAFLYGKIIVNVLQSKELKSKPQNHNNSTYSLWRNEEDYRIDWSWDSKKIIRFIDAVGYPYLGALTTYYGTEIRIIQAVKVSDVEIVNRTPGKLFKVEKNRPIIVCGKGMVQINKAVTEKSGEEIEFDKLRVRLQ